MRHTITAYALTTGAAFAHGGHEEAVLRGEAHWLTTGDHLIVLGLAGLAVGFGLRAALRHTRRVRAGVRVPR